MGRRVGHGMEMLDTIMRLKVAGDLEQVKLSVAEVFGVLMRRVDELEFRIRSMEPEETKR